MVFDIKTSAEQAQKMYDEAHKKKEEHLDTYKRVAPSPLVE